MTFTIIGADQKQYGPSTVEEVREWIKDGRADGRTLALAEGGTEWKPLSAYPEFAGYTAAGGVPPRLASTASARISPAYSNDPAAPLLAAEPDFDVGLCLGHAWSLLMGNFALLTIASTLIWVPGEIPIIGGALSGVLSGGLYLVYLKRIRGQETSIGEAFAGFSGSFVNLFLAGVVTIILTSIAYCFCVLPCIYLKVAWIFAFALVIDKRLEFWTAMELSRTVASRVWFKVFALAVIAFAPYILCEGYVYLRIYQLLSAQMTPLLAGGIPDLAGMMGMFTKMFAAMKDIQPVTEKLQVTAEVVLLVNLPFATGALMFAYEALFGSRPAPAA